MNGGPLLSDKDALRKLFVGGIPISTTDEEFSEYFSSYGEVSDSVIIKDSNTKKSRGFGFITFTNYQDLNSVLQNRPHRFENKEVEVKRAIPRENTSPTAHLRCKKLFVGGVPREGDEEEFRQELNSVYDHCGLGSVTKIDFIKDRDTGKNKGFGFIEVDSEDLADLIIIYDNAPSFNGKRVEIKKAEDRGVKGGVGQGRGRGRGGPPGARGGFSGGGYGGSGFGGTQDSYGSYGGNSQSFAGGDGSYGNFKDNSYGGGYSNGNSYGGGQSYGGGTAVGGGGYSGFGSGFGGVPDSGYGTGGQGTGYTDYNSGGGGYGQSTGSFGPARGGRGGRRYQPY